MPPCAASRPVVRMGLLLVLLVGAVGAASAQAPVPPPVEFLPVPKPILLPPLVLPACPAPQQPAGVTPKPSAQLQKDYGQFIERTVEPENVLELVVGIPKLLVFKEPPARVQVGGDGKEKVVEDKLITPRELSLTGLKTGRTVLNLWFGDPKAPGKQRILSYLVRVVPDRESAEEARRREVEAKLRTDQSRHEYYKELERQINRAFPDSRVRLTIVGNSLLVCGQAHDIEQATQIMHLVDPQSRGGQRGAAGPTIVTRQGLAGSVTKVIPPPAPDAPGEVQPAGFQPEQTVAERGPRLNVVNQLRVPGEQQVMLKVVVAEVNRAAARSIGLNFSITNNQGVKVFENLTGGLIQTVGTTTGANLPIRLDNGQVFLALQALKTMDLVRVRAEPNLTALNGQTASFLAGGQFPVPVVTGFTASGLQGVDFVNFGVQLQFVPTITDKDRIRLEVAAVVSARDDEGGANVGGTQVPGLDTREFQTIVELREGQTLAVAGLLKTDLNAKTQRVPLIGDLPFFGLFGRADTISSTEQELVILVTPQLVHPLEHGETPPLPGDDVFEPSDLEFYLLSRIESRRPYDYRAPVMTDLHRMRRYRRCEEVYILGPHGHSDGNH